MILSQIAKDRWTVLAPVDKNGGIPLLDFLMDSVKSGEAKEKMLSLLTFKVPTEGPPKNEEKCRKLKDGIYEFKSASKRGPKVRVLFFYDKGNIVICSNFFLKDQQKTPPREIEKAKEIREQYLNDKKAGKNTIKN